MSYLSKSRLLVAMYMSGGFFISNPAVASNQFIDPVDGRLDASQFILDNAAGFLPVPIMITDPAVGMGGGGALLFFHESAERKARREAGEQVADVPASVSGLVGLSTENGTKVYGAFHSGNWLNDRVRYMGGLFKADVNLVYNFPALGTDASINTEGNYFFQELDIRLGDSNVFFGAGYTYMNSVSTFTDMKDIEGEIPSPESKDADLSLKLTYDSRNNQIAPKTGTHAGLKWNGHRKTLGGDHNFNRYHAYVQNYQRLTDKWGLALRGDYKTLDGEAPFYSSPYVEMRGIAAMTMRNDNAALMEAELSYDIDDRWTVLTFAGIATAYDHQKNLRDANWSTTGGGGFRYLIARQLGITSGLDVAQGPKETALYIQFGSAW
ncbi:BamA/TamA family outer membrane protein [Vibrio sp.]|uniref:BamA/TamA family outer membrane protein n=1 Tax=Vibrio sp. TaxID=678 RepID=UPI003D10BAF6